MLNSISLFKVGLLRAAWGVGSKRVIIFDSWVDILLQQRNPNFVSSDQNKI